MESFTVLSGCASRGTTGLPQEVHVLNLRIANQGAGRLQREVSAGVAVRDSSESEFYASVLGPENQNSSHRPCNESTTTCCAVSLAHLPKILNCLFIFTHDPPFFSSNCSL